MFERFIHFIKYNNATIFILVVIFIVGASAFASEVGREAIGKKTNTIVGIDNMLLLEADLDNFDMDFKIERIEEDDSYYYVTYTYIELLEINKAWQYQLKEKSRKVSKKLKKDLGEYLAEELKEDYLGLLKELKKEQANAKEEGESKRVEVTEYSGLIGGTLNIASKVFDGYEPVKKIVMNSPASELSMRTIKKSKKNDALEPQSSGSDNLTDIYNDYMQENDPDLDNIFGASDNCFSTYNPDQSDSDGDGVGDACDIDNIEPVVDESNDSEDVVEEDLEVEIVDLESLNDTPEEPGQAESPSASSVQDIESTPPASGTGQAESTETQEDTNPPSGGTESTPPASGTGQAENTESTGDAEPENTENTESTESSEDGEGVEESAN